MTCCLLLTGRASASLQTWSVIRPLFRGLLIGSLRRTKGIGWASCCLMNDAVYPHLAGGLKFLTVSLHSAAVLLLAIPGFYSSFAPNPDWGRRPRCGRSGVAGFLRQIQIDAAKGRRRRRAAASLSAFCASTISGRCSPSRPRCSGDILTPYVKKGDHWTKVHQCYYDSQVAPSGIGN